MIERGRTYTKIFCAVAFARIVIYDVWVYLAFGGDATISRLTYELQVTYPPIGQLLLLSIGFLLGHLFWSQKIKG